MQQRREWKRNRVIPIALLIGAALVLLAGCGDGGGGYAIVALPAGAGWWSGVRPSRMVGTVWLAVTARLVPGAASKDAVRSLGRCHPGD